MKKELKTDIERIAYNCRQATLLIEKKQEVALTSREKMELKIHLAGCYICRVYENQSILINQMMHKLLKGAPQDVKLDPAFKKELQQRIDENSPRQS